MPLDARIREVQKRLAKAIPRPRCELAFATPWQLLVATILSAQSTDATVNRVTPELFRRWPTPAALAGAPQEAVEKVVKSTGFFRNKAKAIRAASRVVAEEHGGAVPRDLATLVTLPGVARLVLHGRYVCRAQRPACAECALQEVCPAAEHAAEGAWTARARREAELVG